MEEIKTKNRAPRELSREEIDRQFRFAEQVAAIHAQNGRAGENAPKCFVQTFGCQQNEADSERIAGLACLMGYTITHDPAEAKLILVNTCAVREHAEKKALSIIGQYKHLKEADPEVIIGVGGCMVTQQHRADQLKRSYPYVSFVFDTAAVHTLPELVAGVLGGRGRKFFVGGEGNIAEGIPTHREISYKAWLSVMYGCNNFCSYCIVPYTRGRERSRTPEAILTEARQLIDSGAKDITLLGQNVNSYGRDLDGASFAELIDAVANLEGDFRLRFMTSHPKDASDELIEVMAKNEKIVRHFHLPLQSGSNEILSRMNRRYTAEKYYGIVEKLRSAMPDISLSSDIIVGFPGETEEDFEATMDMLRRVQYDAIFSFIYSPRKGTPAAEMADQVPHEVSTARFERMLALQNEISLQRNQRFVGRTVRVLAEEISHGDSNRITGRGDSPRPIHFVADPDVIGQFVNVKITAADTFSLMAELI